MNPAGPAQRSTKDGPFCWQGKELLRLIADACDDRTDRALVLAVYLALTWISSDKQSQVFAESKARIAERAGVSYRKVAEILGFLARLGVITIAENFIEGSKERGPNTYTLGTACTGSGTACQRLGTDTKQGTVPRLIEESPEQDLKNLCEEGRDAKGAPTRRKKPTQIDDDWLAELCTDPAFTGIDVRREHAKMIRWYETKGRVPTRLRLIGWLNRAERPMTGTNTGLAGANRHQMPALSDAEHAKGFFNGTEFQP